MALDLGTLLKKEHGALDELCSLNNNGCQILLTIKSLGNFVM
jgi:hypothetical protein